MFRKFQNQFFALPHCEKYFFMKIILNNISELKFSGQRLEWRILRILDCYVHYCTLWPSLGLTLIRVALEENLQLLFKTILHHDALS